MAPYAPRSSGPVLAMGLALFAAGCGEAGVQLVLSVPDRPAAELEEVARGTHRLEFVWHDEQRASVRLILELERIQVSGRWQPVPATATLAVSTFTEGIRVVPRFAGDQVGGYQVRVHLRSVPRAEPRWLQFGYAKYAPAGVVPISGPVPRDADGIVPQLLAAPELPIEELARGLALHPRLGWWTTVLRLAPEVPRIGIGACRARHLRTRLAAGTDADGVVLLAAVGGLGATAPTRAGIADLEPLCLSSAWTLSEAQRRLASRFEPVFAPPSTRTAPRALYSTWHADFAAVTFARIRAHLRAIGASSLAGLFDAFQVDDGYQQAWGDWLRTAPEFGASLTELAAAIRAAGYRPGIWWAPPLVAADSSLARNHPDWILRRRGQPVRCSSCNTRGIDLWVLDMGHPEVLAHLQEVQRGLQRAGFELFKIDFLATALAEGDSAGASTSPLDRFHAMLAALRSAWQDGVFVWSATQPLLPTLGALHGYRVAGDVGFPFFSELPLANWYHYARAIAARGAWLANFGVIDPDGFFVRGYREPEALRTLAALPLLSGGIYAVGEGDAYLDRFPDPRVLPAPLWSSVGSGDPWRPVAPFEHVVVPWLPVQLAEAYLGTERWAEAQPEAWLRPSRTGATILVVNWAPRRRRIRVPTAALARMLPPGRYQWRSLPARGTATASALILELPPLGSRLLELVRK